MNLNQITIPVSDLEFSIEFYKVLGLKLIVYSKDHYARFECPKGDSTFSLHQYDRKPKNNNISIYFEVDDLKERVTSLTKQGVEFEMLPKDQTWLWKEAHLFDPDKHKLIIYTAGQNRKNPPWRID